MSQLVPSRSLALAGGLALLAASACAPHPGESPTDAGAAAQEPAPRAVPPARPLPPPGPLAARPAPAERARLLGQPQVELQPPARAGTAPRDGAVTVQPEVVGPRPVPEADPAATPGTTVALLVPQSGENDGLGASLLRAAQMAVFDGAGPDFTLRPYDTEATPEGARAAAEAAVADGAQLILGPVFAENVATAGAVAREADVPLIAFSTDRTVAGAGVYIMGFPPATQVQRMADYARDQGHRRFAVFAPDTAYGLAVIAALQEIFRGSPGELVRVGTFDPDLEEIRGQVRGFTNYKQRQDAFARRRESLLARLRTVEAGTAHTPIVANMPAAPWQKVPPAQLTERAIREELARLEGRDTAAPPPFDAIFLPAGGDRLLTVAPLLPFFDVPPETVQFLGTGLWDDDERGFEPALDGAWYPAAPPERRARFEKRYRELYAAEPRRLATLAYDGVALAAFLARRQAGDPYRPEALERPAGFTGRDGLFRFRADGTVERALAIFEIGQDQDRVIDPAPRRFDLPEGAAGS